MFKSNIADVRKSLMERQKKAKTAVSSVMRAGDYHEEMVRVAQSVISAETPIGHEYLVQVLGSLVRSRSSQGRMQFFIEYPPMSGISHMGGPVGSWGGEDEQMKSLKSISMDAIKFWVSHFKDMTSVDEGLSQEDIASNVWHAINGKEGNPEAFINPGSHKGHDPKSSLLAVSGYYGANLTDPEIVSSILDSVLVAWKAHMAQRLPSRVRGILFGNAQTQPF